MNIMDYCALALLIAGAFLLWSIIRHDNGTGGNEE